MNYYLKKRIDIIVETPLLRTIIRRLDEVQVPGYSVLPVIEGRGQFNSWSSEGQVSDAASMVAIMCIVDQSRVDEAIEAIFDEIRDHIGFVTVSDVQVIRRERF